MLGGTILVQHERSPGARAEARRSSGEAGLAYGRLVLYGDPDLLARIRGAVAE